MITLDEALGVKKAVFTFGRFQPPTIGHALLLNAVLNLAKSSGADAKIFVSKTQDPKKNPLTWTEKVKYIKLGLPAVKSSIVNDSSIINPFGALRWLVDAGYTDIVMVVGQDRVKNFKDAITPYLNVKDGYKVHSFKVVSAGERDPDSDDVTGMSASKMRGYALSGDLKGFKVGCLPNLSSLYSKELYLSVRRGLRLEGLSEMLEQLFVHKGQIDDVSAWRQEMPQFNTATKKDFLKKIVSGGIPVTTRSIPVGALRVTQKDFDPEKVKAIMRCSEPIDPIITSSDGYIVDGHHRWLAMCWLQSAIAIKCYVVDMPILRLLDIAHSFLDDDEKKITEEFLTEPTYENI